MSERASGWVNKEGKNERGEGRENRRIPFSWDHRDFFFLSPSPFLFPIISPSHESAKLSSKRADAIFYGYLSNATPRSIFGGPRANNQPGTFLITVFDIWSRFVFQDRIAMILEKYRAAIELRIIEERWWISLARYFIQRSIDDGNKRSKGKERERENIYLIRTNTVSRYRYVYYNTLLTYSAILKLDEFSILIYSEMKLVEGGKSIFSI